MSVLPISNSQTSSLHRCHRSKETTLGTIVEATVVVDKASETFGNGGMYPEISARLVKVIRKKETQ